MKKILIGLCVLLKVFTIFAQSQVISQEAYASYYGDEYHGRQTANGEIYDMNAFTAAHRTLAFGSIVEVTNLDTGASVFVRINDRGPFVANREIDLSKAAANAIGMLQQGIARVSIKLVNSSVSSEAQPQVQTQPSYNSLPNYNTQGYTSQPNYTQPNYTNQGYSNQVYTQQGSNQNYYNQGYNSQGSVAQPYSSVPTIETTNKVYTPYQITPGLVLWRIQLGSFTHEENAYSLVESLRSIGFEPAYERVEKKIRVVLYGIREQDLSNVKSVLKANDFIDYIIRQESW